MKQKEECEEDIQYIQTHIIPGFKFDFSSAIDTKEYYSQLHGIMSAIIFTHILREVEHILFSSYRAESNGIQQREEAITSLGRACSLKTLNFDEQFAVFCLLRDNDDVETLLQLSMEECNTKTYEALKTLFSIADYKRFVADAPNVNYSATKVSQIAQAICLHSHRISELLYHHTIGKFLLRIDNFNKDFVQDTHQTKPSDFLSNAYYLGLRRDLLGLNIDHVSSFIESFELEYGNMASVNPAKVIRATLIEAVLLKMAKFRQTMLEQFISDLTDEIKAESVEEALLPLKPTLSSVDDLLVLNEVPTYLRKVEDVNAFCAAFANHCEPNDSKIIKKFFWGMGDGILSQMVWRSTQVLFVAFVHYAYKDADLPDGTEDKIKKLFVCKGKPINIAGYGKSKYEEHYSKVETELSLNRQ